MRIVVLAAGTGSRLEQYTTDRTKAMVPAAGKPLIDYLLDFVDPASYSEILVVGGYCFSNLADYLQKKDNSRISVVENRDYLKGNIFTLVTALDFFSEGSFLLCNADHVYPPEMFAQMKKSFKGITAMCDLDRPLTDDDMKVKAWKDTKRVQRISKKLTAFDYGYIGMTYVDEKESALYRRAVEETLSLHGDNAVVENVLGVLGNEIETAPRICDLSGFGWYEIDDAFDLKAFEEAMAQKSK